MRATCSSGLYYSRHRLRHKMIASPSLTLDHPKERRYRPKTVLRSACAFIFCILAFAALWPFNPFPRNQVSWLPNGNGIRFGRDGIVYSSRALDPHPSGGKGLCSLEIWLEPASSYVESSETILGFYSPGSLTRFRLLQRHDELLVQQDFKDQRNRLDTAEIKAVKAFQGRSRTLFTITATEKGTAVYRDAQFVESYSRFGMTCESVSGQLIIGNSPSDYDPWQGSVFGLAFYREGLSKDQIRRHLESWNQGAVPAGLEKDGLVGFYPLSDGGGPTVHDSSGEGADLTIPNAFAVPHKPFLASPWQEFSPSFDYLWDVLVNIGGFVPFGFFLCAYFSCERSRYGAAMRALALGGLVSLSFEVLQGMLPTRSSGMTDIITNTLGTGLGVLLCRWNWARNLIAKCE